MQYYGTQAYMQGRKVVVLRKDLAPEYFDYDGSRLTRSASEFPEIGRIAQAHANWSSFAYEKRLYRPAE
jgi:hypothetical protein